MYLKTIILLAIILCETSCRLPVRWVSDGKGKIFAVNEKTIHVIENDKPVLISEIGKDVTTVCTCAEWNMDKNILAVAATSSAGVNNKIYYVSISTIDQLTKKETVLMEESGNCVFSMRWSNDGMIMAYARIDGIHGNTPKIHLRVVNEAEESRLLIENSTLFFCWHERSENTYIIAGRTLSDLPDFKELQMGEIVMVNVKTGEITKLLDSAYSPLSHFAPLSDREIFMSLPDVKLPFVPDRKDVDSMNHGVFKFDIESQKLTKISAENSNVIFFALSPDKSRIVWIDEETSKLQILDLSGKALAEAGTTEWLEFIPFWKDDNIVCYMEELHSEKPEERKRSFVYYDCKEKKSRQASGEIDALLPKGGIKVPDSTGKNGK